MNRLLMYCVALGICVAPALATAQTPSCETCLPGELAQTNWSGDLDVCFQYQTFSPDQRTWIEQGVDLIEEWLGNNSVGISFSFRIGTSETSCDNADVKVRAEPNISSGGQGGPSYGIGFAPNTLASSSCDANCWKWLGAHEMMHVLGLDHTDQDCATSSSVFSIMVPVFAGQTFPTSMPCGDARFLTDRYRTGSSGGDDYTTEWSQDYEDCWDIYHVFWVYWYDEEGQYHEQIVASYYVDWTCEPPI